MRLLVLTLALLALAAPAAAEPTLRVDVSRPGIGTSEWVMGVDHVFSTSLSQPPANWLAALDAPNPAVVSQAQVAGVRLVRFPGGREAGRYSFKDGIGAERAGCQTSGVRDATQPLSNVYGFDEHMQFVEAIGAEAQIMVPFAFETAQDAADWVEYANAANDGSNPGGGVDWAQVRAANGHPAPYGVTRWEIGNEPDRPAQRYWLSAKRGVAREQYLGGGVHSAVEEPADGPCAWSARTAGVPSQVVRTRYAPVRPDGFQVAIGGRFWRRVPDLTTVPAGRHVFTLDPISGEIRFGDGAHGAIPPVGRRVLVSYRTGRLPGFEAFRRAMRRIDPGIQVCATWADAQFLRDRPKLDCLSVHPFTTLSRYGGVLYNAAHYDAAMKGADDAADRVAALQRELRRLPGSPFMVTTEFGEVGGSAKLEPGSEASMIHAMYMASEQLAWLRQGIAWALGGRLTDVVSEIIRGAGDRLTPAGELLRVLDGVPGRRLVHATVKDNPETNGYDVLRTVAVRGENGALSVIVANRDREQAIDVRLELPGFTASGVATIAQATSAAFDSADATYEEREIAVADGTVLALPAHSLTRIDLR